MHSFQKITADIVEINPFEKIGKDWMIVTAGNEEKANSMTASWGALGQMWGKDAAFVVIRESRYTKEFIDKEGKFSLSFPKEDYRKVMKFIGAVSGRNEDKMKEAGIDIDYYEGVPYVDAAPLVLICRVMSASKVLPEDFKDEAIEKDWYKDGDYHTLYIAEITDILAR